MNDREQRQIRLIIENELAIASEKLNGEIEGVYAEHSRKGVLRSGATLKAVVQKCESTATSLLDSMVPKVEDVHASPAAFEMLNEALLSFADKIEIHMPRLLIVANANMPSTKAAVDKLIKEMTENLGRKIELARYRFDQPMTAQSDERVNQLSTPQDRVAKRTGRPLAEHWSNMWAATAFALHVGELKPTRQAHIETFMLDWLVANDFNGNLSTVRGHARRLWSLLEADE